MANPKFQARHYNAIAEMLSEMDPFDRAHIRERGVLRAMIIATSDRAAIDHHDQIVQRTATEFARDNVRFNRDRFIDAAYARRIARAREGCELALQCFSEDELRRRDLLPTKDELA